MKFVWPWELSRRGVVGINQRNADFVLPLNDRSKYPLVDDKLLTKKLAQKHGLAVPELFARVESNHDVRYLRERIGSHQSFVIKPACGSGGQGILVFVSASKERFRTIHGPIMTIEQLEHHVLNILTGMFSLGGQADHAIIEYRVEPDPLFEALTFKGVPDVRIILYRGVPIMSMVRLPTSSSEGKANLHQGAIGAGVSMADGTTLTAVCGTEIVTEHPDTGHSVLGMKLPHWEELLDISVQCSDLVGLGYLGVDLVIDRTKGPLILEMNARPGLSIQIANRSGLAPRIQKVESFEAFKLSKSERIEFARAQF